MTKRFEKIDPASLLGFEPTGIDLEVGFGQSSFIVEHALRNPTRLIVGVEVRKQAVAYVQEIATSRGCTNALLLHGNGMLCLEDLFHNETLSTIFIFHPDPWAKRRHHKRRLITPSFIELCITKLKTGGKIHVSTDVQSLWEEITAICAGFPNRLKQVDDPFWVTDYATRWDDFSKQRQRTTFCSTFYKN